MQYLVKALRTSGEVVSLTLEAADELGVRSQLQAQGLSFVSVKANQVMPSMSFGGAAQFDLLLFTQELVALLDAGLSVVEAVETLAEKEARPRAQHIIQGLIRAIYEGRALSVALEQFPEVFPPLYIASVRASEQTGNLQDALSRYSAYQLLLNGIRKKIVGAAIYPLFLLFTGVSVTLFLLGYVVPSFSTLFEGAKNISPTLQMMMSVGLWIKQYAWLIGLGFVGGFFGFLYALTLQSVRQQLMSLLWHIHFFKMRFTILELARMYRSVGMLLQGGIPVVQALNMVKPLLHPTMQLKLALATEEISNGMNISDSLARHELTTTVASRMLRVGEQSGQMGEMMERIAKFFDEDVARWIDLLTKLLAPVLMLLIAVLIGGVVIMLYIQIFDLIGSAAK